MPPSITGKWCNLYLFARVEFVPIFAGKNIFSLTHWLRGEAGSGKLARSSWLFAMCFPCPNVPFASEVIPKFSDVQSGRGRAGKEMTDWVWAREKVREAPVGLLTGAGMYLWSGPHWRENSPKVSNDWIPYSLYDYGAIWSQANTYCSNLF